MSMVVMKVEFDPQVYKTLERDVPVGTTDFTALSAMYSRLLNKTISKLKGLHSLIIVSYSNGPP